MNIYDLETSVKDDKIVIEIESETRRIIKYVDRKDAVNIIAHLAEVFDIGSNEAGM